MVRYVKDQIMELLLGYMGLGGNRWGEARIKDGGIFTGPGIACCCCISG